jgi:peptidoglycan/LPS O-acetylase OafA/YrhL
MTSKKNAFDLLRLLLAISVLISHSILIGGYKLQDPLSVLSKNQTSLAEFGVMGFFTLSGYLITASFENSKNPLIFISHRLLRILPAFWVCLIITAFVLAPLIFCKNNRSLSAFPFTGDGSSLSYLFSNFFLLIKQWSIKNVLDYASYGGSLNGSLWSLYPEILCYFFTFIAGVFGLFNKNKLLYLMITITVLVFFAINFNFNKSYGPTILILSPALKLYASFMAGSLIYVFRDKMILDERGTIFLFFFTLMLIKFGGFNLISPLLIALTLISAFQLFELRLKYDVSYGVYIYSFPIQQLLFHFFGSILNVITFICFSLLISFVIGFLSYILIEKPCIDLRKRTDSLLQSLL